MTDITLRVVGIFYNTTVDLGEMGGTVKEVLDAATNAVTTGDTFSYVATPRTDGFSSPESFKAFYQSGFTRGTGPSIRTYDAGTYELKESFSAENPDPAAESYSVWQYYILDDEKKLLTIDQVFVPFDAPEARVPAGGMVIWRLVTIRKNSAEAFEPIGVPPRIGIA